MPMHLHQPDYLIVYVSDLQRSVAFYRDVLGLPVRLSSPGWVVFDGSSPALALHLTENGTTPLQPPLPPSGQAHLSFIIDDVPGLFALYEQLLAQGARFSLPPTAQPRSGLTVAVVLDPDGFGITLSTAPDLKRITQ